MGILKIASQFFPGDKRINIIDYKNKLMWRINDIHVWHNVKYLSLIKKILH